MTPRKAGPIRVMRIIARLNIGGPAIHVSLLAAGMNHDGFVSQLVAGQIGPGEGDMSYLAAAQGVTPLYIAGLGRDISALDDLRALINLIGLIQREKPDVVHTHTAKAGFVGRLAAWLCGVPVIVHTFHGHTFQGYFGPFKTRIFIVLEQLAGWMSSVILTISDRLRDDLVGYRIAPAEKIQVIPLGLDLGWLTELDAVHGGLRRQLQVGPEIPLVGIVGRLVPIKNHDLFLRAAVIIAKENLHVRFVVVGDGELRATLEDAARRYGIGDRVDFIGWQRDLSGVYADLDILVLTSDNEGTPVSIIEAMAARVPVVSTSVGGVPDLLENGAFGALAELGNPESVAAAILDVLRAGKDPARLDKAQRAALDIYSSERLIADLRALYLTQLKKAGVQVEGG